MRDGMREAVELDGVVFRSQPRYVSIDCVHWYEEHTPMGMFIDGMSFVRWIAEGCPMMTVTKVDEASGTITMESTSA